MKVIVAGSRLITSYKIVEQAILEAPFYITELVSGGARGVDQLGEHWADVTGTPIKYFHADWNKFGKKAGMIRNLEMGDYADALIAVWDGHSHGTWHMISYMQKVTCKPVFVWPESSQVAAEAIGYV